MSLRTHRPTCTCRKCVIKNLDKIESLEEELKHAEWAYDNYREHVREVFSQIAETIGMHIDLYDDQMFEASIYFDVKLAIENPEIWKRITSATARRDGSGTRQQEQK